MFILVSVRYTWQFLVFVTISLNLKYMYWESHRCLPGSCAQLVSFTMSRTRLMWALNWRGILHNRPPSLTWVQWAILAQLAALGSHKILDRFLDPSVTSEDQVWFGLLGFNASATARVISRRWNDDDEISFLVEETGVPGGNHRPTASNWWSEDQVWILYIDFPCSKMNVSHSDCYMRDFCMANGKVTSICLPNHISHVLVSQKLGSENIFVNLFSLFKLLSL